MLLIPTRWRRENDETLLSRITPRVNARDPVMRRRLKNEHKHTKETCVVSFTQPSIGKGKPDPHARQERLASSVSRPLEGRQRRKSPVRRCFKSRSSAETEFAGSPPAAGMISTVHRPLVRFRAVRHTTTGTCDLGKSVITLFRTDYKKFFVAITRSFQDDVKAQALVTPIRSPDAKNQKISRGK